MVCWILGLFSEKKTFWNKEEKTVDALAFAFQEMLISLVLEELVESPVIIVCIGCIKKRS